MSIEELTINHVRIIEHAELNPSSHVNVITGLNAAGKSTILESIDILSRGRSFRTHLFNRLVTAGQSQLTVTARLKSPEHSILSIGIEKSASGTRVRMGGEPVESIAQLAASLPVQVLHPESHQLIQGGPALRRAYLDWGMFHVEPKFLPVWQRHQRALRQRNAALRTGASLKAIRAWHRDFCETADCIDRYRREYLRYLIPVVDDYARNLPGAARLEFRYQRGWPDTDELEHVMEQEISLDMDRGHTRWGPHRAELGLLVDGRPASGTASRGQQKLIAAALRLAQARLLIEKTGRQCVFLIDDLSAELEPRYRDFLLRALVRLNLQIFITAIEADDVKRSDWVETRRFHVEQGRVRELL
ncbi:MAG: DNA replication/repair protein RecF [Gammaproteobacteria bacterium]